MSSQLTLPMAGGTGTTVKRHLIALVVLLGGAVSVAGPERQLRGEFFKQELPDAVLDTTNLVELKLMDRLR